MLGEKIIKLAQSDQVMQEFVNSEQKLQNLNNQFYELTKEYKMGSNPAEYYSFFNFSNIYFWFVLSGLLLLAFGLLFLLAELQQKSKDTKTVVKFKEKRGDNIEEEKVEVKVAVPETPKKVEKVVEKKEATPKKSSSKKPVKIKVVKVK